MASYEHKARSPKLITIEGCRTGLGLRITGGRNRDRDEHFGIFVKEVIPGSLAATGGQLFVGDQLLEANGQSLVDVSNERRVLPTDSIKLLLSRDAAAQSQYRRLSDVLAETHSPLPSSTPKAPVTSTPFHNEVDGKPLDKVQPSTAKQSVPLTPSNVVTDSGMSLPWGSPLQSPNFDTSSAVLQWQKQSTSASKPPVMYPSDDQGLTQRPSSVSSNDSGSHDENEGHKIKSPPDAGKTMPDGSQVALSDVVLSETQSSPAQKPISLSHLHERSVDVEEHGFLTTPPQPVTKDAMSSPSRVGSSLESGNHPPSLDQHTDVITITTDKGLGISLTGGVGRSDGPGIYIAKILNGLDASNDGQLKVGDQILKVNGEPFGNIQLEKAKHLLTQMKTRHVSSYVIQIKRQPNKTKTVENKPSSEGLKAVAFTTASKSSSHIDTSPQPHSNAAVSFFDSSTLVVMDDKPHEITGNSPGAVNSSQSTIGIGVAMPRKRTRQTGFGNSERTSAYDSMRQRLSVDIGARFKLTKLEYALNYIGKTITPEMQEQFRKLDIDEQGKVVLSDFIALCKKMFPLEEGSGNLNFESQLTLALIHKDSLDFPRPNAVVSGKTTSLEELLKEFSSKPGEVSDESDVNSSMGTPVKPGNQPVESSPREHELQKKLALTEKALKASKKKEKDLKNMIQVLEDLAPGRQNNPIQSSAELQKRLAVMDCERKKEQATARRYQVATEKLLQFAEECHDILINSPDASRTLYYVQGNGQSTLRGDQVTGNPRPPRYLSKHAKETAVTLAQKAKEVSLSVHEILKTEELPFGWDKCVNETGLVYYINHLTQTTSWTHPLASGRSTAEAHSHATPLSLET
ncbi:hypothetical protein EMCRGX_G034085 [Ephydatia muelleri]